MTQIKLTKNALRDEQTKRTQLSRYLPTLQLKKALLQVEVNNAVAELNQLELEKKRKEEIIAKFQKLLSHQHAYNVNHSVHIDQVKTTHENIAGVDVPIYDTTSFHPASYRLVDTPLWIDSATQKIQDMIATNEAIKVSEEKKKRLEEELRNVSIRVNLFEKILIPRIDANIKKIKIFLQDQQLAAVAQAKVAKTKILNRKAR